MFIRHPLLTLTLLGALSCATVPPRAAPPANLPAVQLQTLEGRPTRLQDALQGRVGLVAVWATWCEACGAELDALTRLSERAASHGAVVVAVAVGEKRGTVAEFVARRGLRYPQLVDEEFHLADALGQSRVPSTLVVDKKGRIIFTGGALDEAALTALRSALDDRMAAR
jgi:peroxiredoxin